MQKIECDPTEVVKKIGEKLDRGLLLVSIGRDGKPNVMIIGWGLLGILWRRPVFMIAVRQSRYTHKLLEETEEFTVNVPGKNMDKVIDYCGSASGREHDKFKELGLKATSGKKVKAPIISDCIVHFECRVIGKTEVEPSRLSKDVLSSCYPSGDYHTLYFGEILSTYADKDVLEKRRFTNP